MQAVTGEGVYKAALGLSLEFALLTISFTQMSKLVVQ